MKKFHDQLQRTIYLSKTPSRIVSLVPSQTELLVDLGLEEAIVGVTKFCVHPKGLRKEKKVVGGTKKVDFEKISQLNPDIILCNKEENTKEMVLELEKIAAVHVSDIQTLEDSLDLIGHYGNIFEVEEQASVISGTIKNELHDFLGFMKDKPKRRLAYLIWQKPWMVAGKNTFIDFLLDLNHFENVFVDRDSRYPEIDLKAIQDEKVDLVLLSTEPFPFQEKHREEIQKLLPNQRLEIVDGEFFSWYGSRLIPAFKYFKEFQCSLCCS